MASQVAPALATNDMNNDSYALLYRYYTAWVEYSQGITYLDHLYS